MLGEIRRRHSFVIVTELAEAHERGPRNAVEVKWRLLRRSWQGDDAQVLAVVEAAYAAPRLRQLFPYTSHASLHFSTSTGFPYSWEVPYIEPRPDGGYLVCGPSHGAVIGEADSADHAIALVLNHLPPNLGPAVAGTASDADG